MARPGGMAGEGGDFALGLGGRSSVCDWVMTSRWVTFRVPIYRGINGSTDKNVSRDVQSKQKGGRVTLGTMDFNVLVECIFLFDEWFADCVTTESE